MDKKSHHLQTQLLTYKPTKHRRQKMSKNSSAKTPKGLESNNGESCHTSKFKTMHIKSCLRSINRNQSERENTKRMYKTNQTEFDFPHSQSQKTITTVKPRQNYKQNNRSSKTYKKKYEKKVLKGEKINFQTKTSYLSIRKKSVKKNDLKGILVRTQKILQGYQKREQQWLREKQVLCEQMKQIKKKDSTKKLFVHSASAYINTKTPY